MDVQGIRPDIVNAVNTFAVVGGVRVFLRPSVKRGVKIGAGLVVVASSESELINSVENALDGGSMPEGILALQKTPSGAVKVIPCKGKSFIVDNSRVLARIIDRNMLRESSILDLLQQH